jgi:hypothetical protein
MKKEILEDLISLQVAKKRLVQEVSLCIGT